MLKLIPAQNYKVMPWKNGRGTTSEIAIYPEGADSSSENFLWRLSLAEIQTSGPFSIFPGFDRKLVIINGNGIQLKGLTLAPLEVFSFLGDEKINANLVNGPITDLGVMSKRGAVRAEMAVYANIEKPIKLQFSPEGIHYFYCVDGTIAVSNSTILQAGDSLEISDHSELALTPTPLNSSFTGVFISIIKTA